MKNLIIISTIVLLINPISMIYAQEKDYKKNPQELTRQQIDSLLSEANRVMSGYSSGELTGLSAAAKDSFFIARAKDLVLTYGPAYYRVKYRKPTVEYKIEEKGKDAGRTYAKVTFYYDPKEEQLNWNYAAYANIWADNGEPVKVMFGHGLGMSFDDESDAEKRRKGDFTPYQYDATPEFQLIDKNKKE